MALNYTRLQETAERLIEANGRTITLIRKDRGNPSDASKPWRTSTETGAVSVSVIGLVIPKETELMAGALIRRETQDAFVAAKSVNDAAPSNLNLEEYDTLVDGSTYYKIEGHDVINPGASRILYMLEVMR